MTVVGASQYLGAATLANTRGISAVAPNVLGETGLGDLLDSARINSNNGIGLSARSRALTKSFLNSSASGFNNIFSLNGVEFGTNETLQQKILALRSSVPESRLSPELRGERGENIDEEV